MALIKETLSQQEYSVLITHYLITQISFKIINILLWGLVIIILLLYFLKIKDINPFYSLFWGILIIIYNQVMPSLIKKRAETIYQNTLFLHEEMLLDFNDNNIIWSTINGQKTFPVSHIYNIKAIRNALIISFTPYTVIPVKYSCISKKVWNIIQSTYPKKINSKYYELYYQNKEIS